MSKRARVVLICTIILVAGIAVAFMHRIPQPQSYHNFADHRGFVGIPNFMDVVSNVAFLFAGIWGLLIVFNRHTEGISRAERLPYGVFFLGAALTCFGSAYYHFAPNNWTLVWDRLPMTIAFMAILAAITVERISASAGSRLLLPLLLLGAASVVYWYSTEIRGAGDLRFYLCVQFFPALVILMILLLFEPKYTRGSDFVGVIGFYALAKTFEALDRPIFNATHVISGHTLKHLSAATSVFWLARMIQKRRPIPVFRSRIASAQQKHS